MDGDQRWPGRPTLLPGESFSSWFARTAAANGLRPAELLRIMLPGGDRVYQDLDRHADTHLLQRLAEATGVDVRRLAAATFRRWAGLAFEHDNGLNKLPWLPPAGRRGARRCFGQQVCPECLAADPQPYLRLGWRLAFVTTCPVHGRLLLDRCPACGAPFSALLQESRGNLTCWSCREEVGRFTGDAPPIDTAPAEGALLDVLGQGWMEMGDYGPVYSFVVLNILSLAARLLAGGRHAHALRAWVSARAPGLEVVPEAIPRARDGALLTPRARSVLVSMAWWLLAHWPRCFVAAAEGVGLRGSDLIKQTEGHYPFAYANAVGWYVKDSPKRGNPDEVTAAKAVLHSRGYAASRQNLAGVLGTRRRTAGLLAETVATGTPWGQGRYWKLDSVSPEVKIAARKAAHQAGEGVGPWLDAVLRRELNLSAPETPPNSRVANTVAADGTLGCGE